MLQKSILLCILVSLLAMTTSFAALVEDYDIQTTVYSSLDTSLKYHVSTTDLLNGQQGTLISGGFHPATPGNDFSRITTLTDGIFAADGLTVINADFGESFPGFGSLVIEYPFTRPYDISTIRVFAGHNGDGTRGWINVKIEEIKGLVIQL